MLCIVSSLCKIKGRGWGGVGAPHFRNFHPSYLQLPRVWLKSVKHTLSACSSWWQAHFSSEIESGAVREQLQRGRTPFKMWAFQTKSFICCMRAKPNWRPNVLSDVCLCGTFINQQEHDTYFPFCWIQASDLPKSCGTNTWYTFNPLCFRVVFCPKTEGSLLEIKRIYTL